MKHNYFFYSIVKLMCVTLLALTSVMSAYAKPEFQRYVFDFYDGGDRWNYSQLPSGNFVELRFKGMGLQVNPYNGQVCSGTVYYQIKNGAGTVLKTSSTFNLSYIGKEGDNEIWKATMDDDVFGNWTPSCDTYTLVAHFTLLGCTGCINYCNDDLLTDAQKVTSSTFTHKSYELHVYIPNVTEDVVTKFPEDGNDVGCAVELPDFSNHNLEDYKFYVGTNCVWDDNKSEVKSVKDYITSCSSGFIAMSIYKNSEEKNFCPHNCKAVTPECLLNKKGDAIEIDTDIFFDNSKLKFSEVYLSIPSESNANVYPCNARNSFVPKNEFLWYKMVNVGGDIWYFKLSSTSDVGKISFWDKKMDNYTNLDNCKGAYMITYQSGKALYTPDVSFACVDGNISLYSKGSWSNDLTLLTIYSSVYKYDAEMDKIKAITLTCKTYGYTGNISWQKSSDGLSWETFANSTPSGTINNFELKDDLLPKVDTYYRVKQGNGESKPIKITVTTTCQDGTKVNLFNIDFGKLSAVEGDDSRDSFEGMSEAYTHASWPKRINDGYYSVIAWPYHCGCGYGEGDVTDCPKTDDKYSHAWFRDKYFYNDTPFYDHTSVYKTYSSGEYGGMLLINFLSGGTAFERTLSSEDTRRFTENSTLYFSAWFASAAKSDGINMDLIISYKAKGSSTWKEKTKINTTVAQEEDWSKGVAELVITKEMIADGGEYKLSINNHGGTGTGNDVLIDDISLDLCVPAIPFYIGDPLNKEDRIRVKTVGTDNTVLIKDEHSKWGLGDNPCVMLFKVDTTKVDGAPGKYSYVADKDLSLSDGYYKSQLAINDYINGALPDSVHYVALVTSSGKCNDETKNKVASGEIYPTSDSQYLFSSNYITLSAYQNTFSIEADKTTVCFGETITLTSGTINLVSAPATASWQLYDGDSPVSGKSSTVSNGGTISCPVTPSSTSSHSYSIKLTETVKSVTSTLASSNSISVTVNPKPTASISGPSAHICEGSSTDITFTISGGTPNYTINYKEGDTPKSESEITGTTKNVSVSPSNTTTYTLTKVTDSNGCYTEYSSDNTATVNVDKKPSDAVITTPSSTPFTQCGTETFSLVATSPAVGTGTWTITGGSIPEGAPASTTATVAAGNTATATWTVTNGVCESKTASVSLTNNPKPTIDIKTAAACSDDLTTYSLTVTVSEGTVTCNKTATITHTGNDWTISGIASGTNCTLTVKAASSDCENTLAVTAPDCDCRTIEAPTGAHSDSYCAGSSKKAISVNEAATGYRIDWYDASTGGNKVATGASFTPTAAETYYAETVQIASGCKSSTRTSATLTENALPAPVADNDGPACSGADVQLSVGSYTSYSWSGPQSFTSTEQNPKIEDATVDATGDYTVEVTDANGCKNTSTTTVTVNALPTPTANNDGPACSGADVQLSVGSYTSYSWSGPQSFSSTERNPKITGATTDATGDYTVEVTDANGCKNTSTTTVTVNALPTPTANNDGPACSGADVQLSVGSYTSYSWSGPQSFTSTEQNPKIEDATVDATGDYTVEVTDANGCKNTSTTTVTVNPTPELTYKAFDPLTGLEVSEPYKLDCNMPSIRVELSGGSTYQWSDGKTEQSRTIENAVTYSVYPISDKNCVGETKTIEVSSNKHKPVLKLSSKDADGNDNTLLTCTVQELTLDVEVLNPDVAKNVTYEWTFTDGTSTDKSIVVTKPDTYKMIAKAANGCSSDEGKIEIRQDIKVPEVTIEPSSDVILTCAVDFITLEAKADIEDCTFEWNDGSKESTLKVSEEGLYSVKATATNGCVSLAAEKEITDKTQIPVIEITPSAEKVTCKSVILTASSESAGMSYVWDDALSTEGAELEVSKKGIYSVKGTNMYSCVGEATFDIDEDKSAPVITITPNTGTLTCEITSIDVEATETSGIASVSYSWSNGKTTAENNFTEKGTYTVTATNDATACKSQKSITIGENNQYPIVALQALEAVCLPATVDISKAVVVSESKFDDIKYYHDAAGTQPLDNPVVDVETKQIFYVQGFGVDGSGCVGQQIYPIEVMIKDVTSTPVVNNYDECPAAVSKSLKDQVISDRSSLTFYDAPEGGTPRSDMFDASKENTDAVYYVTNTEAGKCESDRAEIDVHIDGTIDIEVTADDDEVYAGQQEVTVSAKSLKESQVNTYKWQKNAIVLPETGSEVTTLLYSNTKFTVTGEGRCNSVSKEITIRALWPTLITPKTGTNGHFAKGCDITVFNRFNEKVFQGNDGWDGTLDCNFAPKGEIASPGVYYYYINIPDGGTHRGTIEVVKF